MKALSYSRKAQYSNEIEKHIGLYDKPMMNKYSSLTIINPILDGYLCKGLAHVNAIDIVEIDIDTPLDLATGEELIID